MKRKLVTLIVALLVCTTLLFAAGVKEKAPTSGLSGKVTMLVDTGHVDLQKTFVEPFNKIYPDIEIEFIEVSPLERLEKLIVMLGSGTGPDLIETEPAYYTELVPNGYLYNIDPLVAADSEFSYDMFDPNGISAFQMYDGVTRGLPISPYNKVLLFNKKTFDKYGVDYPYYGMTMEDLIETARALQRKMVAAGDDKNDMRPFCQWEIHLEPFTSAMGVGFYDVDTLKHNFDDPKVQKALKFWQTLWSENLLMTKEEAKAKGYGDSYKLFVQGQYPMIIENAWITRMTQDPEVSRLPYEYVYDVIPVPWFAGEAKVQPPITVHGVAMTSQVKNKDAAWAVMKFAAMHWFTNEGLVQNVINPVSYLDSEMNKILTEDKLYPGFKNILEVAAAVDPPYIPELYLEIVWQGIMDVMVEGTIEKTPFDKLVPKVSNTVQSILDRYKREIGK
jgi:multiple sugar transport system substrate-binding protein